MLHLFLSFSHLYFSFQLQGLMVDFPQRLTMPQRMASLSRFREKRKERNFDKKIRYTVRKEVAQRYTHTSARADPGFREYCALDEQYCYCTYPMLAFL